MSDLKRFQEEHGEQWASITQHPAFMAALSYLNLEKIREITNLSDEEIKTNGHIKLADLRGHLKHEEDLYALATKQDLTFRPAPPEEYGDPLLEIIPPEPEPPTTAEETAKPKNRRTKKP